jgi:hypothetical protein
MDPKNRRAYTGRSGELAVMAELIDRGCNVAVPEVDVGKDLLAFQDDMAEITHIQVQTAGKASALRGEGRYSAQIDVPLDALEKRDVPPLHYVFAMRLGGRWADFIVSSRERLGALRQGIGTEYIDTRTRKRFLKLKFSFAKEDVRCGGQSFQEYRNAWQSLPALRPAPPGG